MPKWKSNYLVKFISCCKHTKIVKDCQVCLIFRVQEQLPNGTLPTTKQVLAYLFYLNSENMGQKSNSADVALNLMLHWICANVYTIANKNVYLRKLKAVETYSSLKKVPHKKIATPSKRIWRKFMNDCENLFDIKCADLKRIKEQENI